MSLQLLYNNLSARNFLSWYTKGWQHKQQSLLLLHWHTILCYGSCVDTCYLQLWLGKTFTHMPILWFLTVRKT